MDVATYLQCFESSLSSYTGDDPLDPWDKFVEYLEQRLPADSSSGMSVVFDSLVQRFLNVERYANDIRYVNYCIKCASYYSDPIAMYSHVFSRGIGTRTAALYVAWAQQFEQRGMNDQADAVYQKAVENQAQPADTVLHEYRQFQTRTRSQAPGSAGGRNPLQNSHLTNQMSSHREPASQSKTSVDCLSKPPAVQTAIIVSRSETSGAIRSGQSSSVQTVSEYMTDELVCEGSEFCFEEVRAEKYFRKLRETQEKMDSENLEKLLREQEEGIQRIKSMLEEAHHSLEARGGLTSQPASQRLPAVETAASLNPDPTQQPFGRPRPSNRLSSRRSLGLRLHTEPAFIQEATAVPEPPPPPLQNHTRPDDRNTLSSEVSHHPSVLAGHLPISAATPVSADPASLVQAVQPRSVQQPVSFEPMNLSSLHRPACASAVNTDVFCQDGRPQEHSTTHQDVSQLAEPEEKLNVSQGGTVNLSHITPNNSLGYVQATPSRVLPSPTVNTREALDVIMDMFQAPTLLEDPFSSTSALHTAEREFEAGHQINGGASSFTNPPTTAPFTIFQDDNDKENGSAAAPAAVEKSKPIRALVEIPVSKPDRPNETPPDLMPDESTMWGARYNSLNSLAACPNSTTDFAMLAQFVSTPFTHKTPFNGNFYQDQENNCDGGDADDDAFIRRQPKKLSPIIEQSPSEEKLSETAVSQLVPSSARQGTIVGEGLAAGQHCLTTSSITMVQPPPPAVLSFRDQTLCPTDSSVHRSAGPGWEVYTSPEQPSRQASLISHRPESSVRPKSQTFKIMEDVDRPASPEPAQNPASDVPMSPECALRSDWLDIKSPEVRAEPDLDAFLRLPNKTPDVPMSPDCALKPNWLEIRSPEVSVEPDLDAFLSPCRPKTANAVANKTLDVPMSPDQPQLCADVPMSPMQLPQFSARDEPMMSPDRGPTSSADMSMNTTARTGAVQLVPDPWDNELISDLLSALTPPLTSHPRCITWPCNVPSITPKMTISMGKASLRVDSILGKGAFATVYQATDPMTSERMVLKVQKPACPWEFYINTQLDARLQPSVRHLYSSIRSAHLFHNGSVMLGELHGHGTLLNAVNMYKTLSDKVMPQPLVMYFTVCILHMVEQLHDIHIIHADIKPDNFLLGERFLENKCFDSENVDHGLVLIDLGQSIDMELFPGGTAFTAKCLTSGFQCTEMLSGKPWNYQTDYFGIAGTVFCMLFGTYMRVTNEGGVWKTNAVFRRNPHSDLWLEFFHTLLNVPDCGSLPSLRSLRCKLTSVLQQNYSSKLPSLKSRLVVLLLESRRR
ncbi:mitotic checkpoint serine/threonine-protein kinase BUB1 isoform X1 [Lates calcarifer]|uniref:Mitotic checkpoint serine/threonine-protein kinase BUB1 isoform X1 n=1 Tax=Lates calcarifer TaxID=8187 RepID=A0AAJ7LTF8_LATCA|nr:mitotic checkpoint serine/threonine-protein kinase BUB1 isoform X1 [Lates calcarifer]